MATKLNPTAFADWCHKQYQDKCGYIMCAVGQDPQLLLPWYYTGQYSGKQLEKAYYWRDHAPRVFDCQGLADCYLTEQGTRINVRARDNYAAWCSIRGEGKIPAPYRVPGAAVFIDNGKYISHVGFLWRPVAEGDRSGDWWVIEAKGVMYGVVKTRLNAGGWNRWGWMDKYFSYGHAEPDMLPIWTRQLSRGDTGDDVAGLQRDLIALGYSCGRYGADGEFGQATEAAVKAFQLDSGLVVDGIVGEKTRDALDTCLPDNGDAQTPAEPAKSIAIGYGKSWHVRTAPNADAPILGIVRLGDTLAPGGQEDEDGWVCVRFVGEVGWISRKAVK